MPHVVLDEYIRDSDEVSTTYWDAYIFEEKAKDEGMTHEVEE